MNVKAPESDSRLVEFLYDEMSPEDRAAFQAELDADPTLRREVSSTRASLALIRRHSVDHAVPEALTERLSAAAARATLPLWRRLLAPFVLRSEGKPAFALGLLALVVIGLGTFLVIGRGGPTGTRSGSDPVAKQEARGPVPAATGDTRTVATREDKGLLEKDKSLEGSDLVASGEVKPETTVDGLRRGDSGGVMGGVGGRAEDPAPRDAAKAKTAFAAENAPREEGERKAAEAQKQPARDQRAAPPAAAPAGAAARGRVQLGLKAARAGDADDESAAKDRKAEAAPAQSNGAKVPAAAALHQLARTNQSRGQLADACAQYGQLVRGYLAYDQRAAALLEWAKCEAARGNHATAETLLKQLIAQYPKFQPAARQLLANVQNERANVARRAQRSTQNVAPQTKGQQARPAKKATSNTSN